MKNKNKEYAIYGVVALAGLVVALAIIGNLGEAVNNRVVDAEINEEALINDLETLETRINQLNSQMNATITVLQSHQEALIQHEQILRQHNEQIVSIANNTNILGNWASEFSTNINERVTALEE